MTESVFVSSTSKDLADHRQAVITVIQAMNVDNIHPLHMEGWHSTNELPVELCKKKVREAQYYIGIFAHRYGYIPDGQTSSITEIEYNTAQQQHKPSLIYVIKDSYAWPDDKDHREDAGSSNQTRLDTFKSRLTKRTVVFFDTPENLADHIKRDMPRLMEQTRFRRRLNRAMLLLGALVLVILGLSVYAIANVFTTVPTSTPTFMTSGFNVLVVGFGEQQQDQSGNATLVQSTEADAVSGIVFASVKEFPGIDHVLGPSDPGIGHILDADPAKRQTAAAQLAISVNADVVIYGTLRVDGFYNIIQPEFYVSAPFAALDPETGGSSTLGSPIEALRGDDDKAPDLKQRVDVLQHFLQGLKYYYEGKFSDSRREYDAALQNERDGLEVLQVLAGNAALRGDDLTAASAYYNAALHTRPHYARALIGRGNALYQLAQKSAGEYPPAFDTTLQLPSVSTCATQESDIPQLLADQALLCFREANTSEDQADSSDIDAKVLFGEAQIYAWMALIGYQDDWHNATQRCNALIDLYEKSESSKQDRIRDFAAYANAWLGLELAENHTEDSQSIRRAINYYTHAIELLKQDVNRDYNKPYIEAFQKRVTTLEGLNVKTPTPIPLSQPPSRGTDRG